jgi:hypothetical protein
MGVCVYLCGGVGVLRAACCARARLCCGAQLLLSYISCTLAFTTTRACRNARALCRLAPSSVCSNTKLTLTSSIRMTPVTGASDPSNFRPATTLPIHAVAIMSCRSACPLVSGFCARSQFAVRQVMTALYGDARTCSGVFQNNMVSGHIINHRLGGITRPKAGAHAFVNQNPLNFFVQTSSSNRFSTHIAIALHPLLPPNACMCCVLCMCIRFSTWADAENFMKQAVLLCKKRTPAPRDCAAHVSGR